MHFRNSLELFIYNITTKIVNSATYYFFIFAYLSMNILNYFCIKIYPMKNQIEDFTQNVI